MDFVFEILVMLLLATVGLFVMKRFNKENSYGELFDMYGDNVAILFGTFILLIFVVLANIFGWV